MRYIFDKLGPLPLNNVLKYALNHFANDSLRSANTWYFPYSTFCSTGHWGSNTQYLNCIVVHGGRFRSFDQTNSECD